MLVCTATGVEVDTHTTYSRADLRRARWARLMLRCPGCRTEHVFDFADARLRPLVKDGQAD
ncbi:MAG: hypothetical protein ACK4UO_17225 [Pseudolabrys sp.]